MLNLENAYVNEDIISIFQHDGLVRTTIVVGIKLRDESFSLKYQRSVLTAAAACGSGLVADIVLSSIQSALRERGIVGKPIDYSFADWLLIRREVYIAHVDFELVLDNLERPLSNTRNAVAGAVMHKSSKRPFRRSNRLVAHEYIKASLAAIEAFYFPAAHKKLRARSLNFDT